MSHQCQTFSNFPIKKVPIQIFLEPLEPCQSLSFRTFRKSVEFPSADPRSQAPARFRSEQLESLGKLDLKSIGRRPASIAGSDPKTPSLRPWDLEDRWSNGAPVGHPHRWIGCCLVTVPWPDCKKMVMIPIYTTSCATIYIYQSIYIDIYWL